VKCFGNRDLAAVELDAFLIPYFTGGENLFESQVAGFLDDQVYGFAVEFSNFLMLAQF